MDLKVENQSGMQRAKGIPGRERERTVVAKVLGQERENLELSETGVRRWCEMNLRGQRPC